jgi:hypothetical protein
VLLNHHDYPELLGLDVENQSLDRRPWDPSLKGVIWLLLRVDAGTV